jgi:hypothetical protein
MAGVDSAGIGEVIQNILAGFSADERGRLVKVSKDMVLRSDLSIYNLECVLDWNTLSITGFDPQDAYNTETNPSTRNAYGDCPSCGSCFG